MSFYNHRRPAFDIGLRRPMQFEQRWLADQEDGPHGYGMRKTGARSKLVQRQQNLGEDLRQ